MFLKIKFLESKERWELFKTDPPKYVYVCTKRLPCTKGGEFGGRPFERNMLRLVRMGERI